MRFDSARAAGLDEARADRVVDGYADDASLSDCERAALALTDCLIGLPQPPDQALSDALQREFSPQETGELALGVGLFLGMSKVLIMLGLEPEDMPLTVISTPGS